MGNFCTHSTKSRYTSERTELRFILPETSCYTFYKKNHCSVDTENEDYSPCINFREIMHTGDICLVIGRNATYLHDLVDNIEGTTVETSKEMHLLLSKVIPSEMFASVNLGTRL